MQRLQLFATVAAPTTIATALLFYFGYVATYARYRYFNVELSALNLTTPEVLLHGVEAIFVPLAGLVGVFIAIYAATRTVRWLVSRRRLLLLLNVAGWVSLVAGACAIGRGLYGIVVPSASASEFPGTSAVALGAGPAVTAVGVWLIRAARNGRPPQPMKRMVYSILAVAAVLGLFWAVNSFAAAYGTGLAKTAAVRITTDVPKVVLLTKERLYTLPPGVVETVIEDKGVAEGDGAPERNFRYDNFHLLIEADGRLFLITAERSGRGGTLVVPFDDKVVLQFVPSG
ncbi:hypothetical protein AB0A74_09655 [Saccharothrix sp. NPDC042600]|uniref:hypothetical protein n=1 Tax=Saccharothrix TaxID=2071 RepID=UPI0033D0E091